MDTEPGRGYKLGVYTLRVSGLCFPEGSVAETFSKMKVCQASIEVWAWMLCELCPVKEGIQFAAYEVLKDLFGIKIL